MKENLQYNGYVASAYYSVVDGVFYGEILGIDDLVSFEGASEDELKNTFIAAVNEYLEVCKQIGKSN